MPNHIQSQVEIKGSKEQIARLVKDTKLKRDADASENEFDFNAIVKMPPSMMITSSSNTDFGMVALSQEYYDKDIFAGKATWWNDQYPGVTNAKELKKFLENSDNERDKDALREGKIALENIKKYGYKDWYDWSNAHWGTKWNAYDVRYITGDDTTIVIEITTAWDTPRSIWEALREQGFEVNGFMYGEMDGYEEIGDKAWDSFTAYQNVEIEYNGR